MNFEDWYNRFIIEHPESLTEFTLKKLLEMSFNEGIFHCKMTSPKFGINTETGKIVHLPNDDERNLPLGGKWMFDDDDIELMKNEIKDEFEEKEN